MIPGTPQSNPVHMNQNNINVRFHIYTYFEVIKAKISAKSSLYLVYYI
jgi:hypothetical protein